MRTAEMTLAFDKASTVRWVDQDGRLHVEVTNISKANVCPYRGEEIPGYRELGLDADRIYQLFRDPEELRKAVRTFDNLPVLNKHVPVSAKDHRPLDVVGSTGTDAEFVTPYLRNSMVIWAKEAIDGVESEKQREISCAYWYKADMTPGVHDGVYYDGRMIEIRGNHVALVEEGRAGPDVLVSDSQLRMVHNMALSKKAVLVKGAIMALQPKLAADTALDLNKVLQGVTNKNYSSKKGEIVSAVKSKLAQDADVDGLVKLIDALESEDAPDDQDEDPTKTVEETPVVDEEGDDEDELLDKLQSLLDRLDKRREVPPADEDPQLEDEGQKVDKTAMDAAITAAVRRAKTETKAEMRAVSQAEADVRPVVGELVGAFDSAEAVYAAALKSMGVDITGISGVPALKALVQAHGSRRNVHQTTVAMDAVALSDFDKAFPGAKRIRVA